MKYTDPLGLEANVTDNSVYPVTMGCPAIDRCMSSWGGDRPFEPGMTEQPDWEESVCKQVGKLTYGVAQYLGIELAKSTVCSTLNWQQCSGPSPYIPWVTGMPAFMHWTQLPGMPEDVYFNGYYVESASGQEVNQLELLNAYGQSVNAEFEPY